MTPERLAEIRAVYRRTMENALHPRWETAAEHKADFIALARTAIPELLDEVERLRKENETLQEDAWKYRELSK